MNANVIKYAAFLHLNKSALLNLTWWLKVSFFAELCHLYKTSFFQTMPLKTICSTQKILSLFELPSISTKPAPVTQCHRKIVCSVQIILFLFFSLQILAISAKPVPVTQRHRKTVCSIQMILLFVFVFFTDPCHLYKTCTCLTTRLGTSLH